MSLSISNFNLAKLGMFASIKTAEGSNGDAIVELHKEGGKATHLESTRTYKKLSISSKAEKQANNEVRNKLLESLRSAFRCSSEVTNKDFLRQLEGMLGKNVIKASDFGLDKAGNATSGCPLTERRISAIVDKLEELSAEKREHGGTPLTRSMDLINLCLKGLFSHIGDLKADQLRLVKQEVKLALVKDFPDVDLFNPIQFAMTARNDKNVGKLMEIIEKNLSKVSGVKINRNEGLDANNARVSVQSFLANLSNIPDGVARTSIEEQAAVRMGEGWVDIGEEIKNNESVLKAEIMDHIVSRLEKSGLADAFIAEIKDTVFDNLWQSMLEAYTVRNESETFLGSPEKIRTFVDQRFSDSRFKGSEMINFDDFCSKCLKLNSTGETAVSQKFLRMCLDTHASATGMDFLYKLSKEKPEALESKDALSKEIGNRIEGDEESRQRLVDSCMQNPGNLLRLFGEDIGLINANVLKHGDNIDGRLKSLIGEDFDFRNNKEFKFFFTNQMKMLFKDRQTSVLRTDEILQVATHAARLTIVCAKSGIDRSKVKISDTCDYSKFDKDSFSKLIDNDVLVMKNRTEAIARAKLKVGELASALKDECRSLLKINGVNVPFDTTLIVEMMDKWIEERHNVGELNDANITRRFMGKFGEPYLALARTIASLLPGDDFESVRSSLLADAIKGGIVSAGMDKAVVDVVNFFAESIDGRSVITASDKTDFKTLLDAFKNTGKVVDGFISQALGKDVEIGAPEIVTIVEIAVRIHLRKDGINLGGYLYKNELTQRLKSTLENAQIPCASFIFNVLEGHMLKIQSEQGTK